MPELGVAGPAGRIAHLVFSQAHRITDVLVQRCWEMPVQQAFGRFCDQAGSG